MPRRPRSSHRSEGPRPAPVTPFAEARQRFWPTGVAVGVIALVVRALHVAQMRTTPFFGVLMGDSRGYDQWAREIAAGDWLGREVFYQAPLYPYFLGAIYSVAGPDLLLVRVLQAAAGALSAVALAYAAARLFGSRAGLVAGLMLALYPPAIFFDGLIQKSVLDVLLLCTVVALVAHLIAAGGDSPRLRGWTWFGLGASAGALSLTRENALALAGVLIVWCLVFARAARRRAARTAFLIAGMAVILAPVVTRNALIGGGFYLTTSQVGTNLYIGNNPRADGTYMALREGRGSPEFERLDARELAEQARGRSLQPGEVSAYWTERAVADITSAPGSWLRLLARKAWLLLNRTEVIDTESLESHAEYSLPLRVLSPVWHFGVLLPLGVAGAWWLWGDRRRLWPLYLLPVVYAASVVLFYVVARYRHPLAPLVMIFAAFAIARLTSGVRPPGRWLPVAAASAVAAALSNWPAYSAASQQAITEHNLAAALQENGRLEEAISHYRRALAFNAAYAPALSNLGSALRATGRLEEALAVYDRALALRPDAATTHLNRGNALMALGRTDDAVRSFRRALRADPDSSAARQALANGLYDAGSAAIESGRLEDGVLALQEAVTMRPDFAEARNNLGIAFASLGRLEEAIAQWEAALKTNPSFRDARVNLERARRGTKN